MNNLASRIRNARHHSGLTLREVERLTGGKVTNVLINMIELGQHKTPSPPKLRAIAKVLKINYLELLILANYITVKELQERL